MISKSWCSIIVLTVLTFKSGICDSCNSWTYKVPSEAIYECYEESTHICSEDIANLTILGINEDEGTVDVGFDYESNCHYAIELSQWSKINNEKNCTDELSTDDLYYHSKYTYNGVSDNSIQSCTKEGTITLKYLNTSCYSIKLVKETHNGDFIHEKSLSSRFLNGTARKLQYYFPPTTNRNLDYRDNDIYLNIWHPILKQLPNLLLNITKKYSHSKYYKFSPSSDNSEVVKYNLCVNNMKNDTDIGRSCSVENNHLTCEIKNLDSGEYTVEYIFKNLIQCDPHEPSVFAKCGEGGTRVILPPRKIAPIEDPERKNQVIFFIITGLGCIVVLLMLAIILCRRKRPPILKKAIQSLIYPDKNPTVGQGKVLLLYAKDADIVMKTMKSFRTALIGQGLEVYDVYDPDQQMLINECEEKWITDKLSDKHMKIIIAETYCGQILLKSSLPPEKLYKKPTCYDRCFPYAMSLIRGTVYANDYTKLFVANIGFDFEKTNCSEFTFLSTSKRFGMPQNFIKLKEELLHDTEDCVIDISQSEKELEEFKGVYEQMKDYIEDPNYLSEVLKVSVSHLNDKFDIEETFKNEIIA